MLTRIFLTSVLLASVSAGPSAGAQERGDPAGGLTYAGQVCATCHAIRKGDNVSPNHLAPAFAAIANTSGVTPISLSTHLRSLHENMPSFTLSPNEQDNVIAYIMSLKHER